MLTVNPGSSSLKLAVIEHGVQVGQTGFDRWDGKVTDLVRHVLRQWPDIGAVAVRFVHGGDRPAAVVLDSDTLDELDGLTRLAPLHQQASVFVASKVMAQLPSVPVVACFDTSFHASMPETARVYGLPTDLTRRHGLRRYGFHGLSCQYALRRVADMVGLDPAVLRVVCVHMGASVSVTAVRAGASVDTSMGFTSLEGAVMATRSGSVDPGLLLHLLDAGIVEPRELSDLLNHGSGLAGMTGTDGDMRTVLPARTRGDRDAELTVDVYMHRLRREIAAVAASLDRLDAVVFTGGVATHNPQLLGEIVDGLGLFGMSAVHELLAAAGDRVVSPLGVLPRVLVITAREDLEPVLVPDLPCRRDVQRHGEPTLRRDMRNPTVASVMTRNPCTVPPDADVKAIVKLLSDKEIGAVPVVDADGVPIGVVSGADLPRKQGDLVHAKDLMSSPVLAVAVTESLISVARALSHHGTHRLFVLDHGKLVGVVSRGDVLEVFLRSDEDIREEILREVFQQAPSAGMRSITATVDHGVVTMAGRLERRSEVDTTRRLVPRIPGVVELRDQLGYEWNDLPGQP